MITKRQKQVLKAINDFIVNNNYSPSVRELASVLSLKSTSTMQGHLDRLQANGYIEKNKNMPRTLRILNYQED
jgi:SOS-response transcriptional repressor LexA